jgi:NTE family protein
LTLIAESNRTKLPTLGISLKGKYQNYNVFENGDKIFDAKIFYTSGALYLYKPFLEWFNLGLGLQEEYYQGDIYKKKDIYPIVSTDPNTFLTNAYSYLSFDNMDDFYFPRKGTNIYAEFSLTADFKKNNNLSPAFLFKMRNVIPVWHKTALLFDFYHRALFNPDFPQPKATLVGGEPYSQYFSYHLPFVGLSAVNIADRYTFIGLVGLRRQVSDSQYFSVLLNCLKQTNDMALLNANNIILGGGIKYGLRTFVGPMDMTLGYSGSTRKPTFSANFGYWF